MTYPTIHTNGTGAQMLLDGYTAAANACYVAEQAIIAIEFNGRDYYPQGPDAWKQASTEYAERLAKIHAVRHELLAISGHIQDLIDVREAFNQ